MKKKKTNLGEKCVTWDCNGKLISVDKWEAKCNKCDRRYWIIERK